MKIVLCGPPRSGKSCFREGLKQAKRIIPDAPYPYIITACPDGEGSWFQEAVNNDMEVAAACKAACRAKFTPEFVRRISESVKNCQLALTLIDVGGIPSEENKMIWAEATHAIILSSDPAAFSVWQNFAKEVGLTAMAEITSAYHATADHIPAKLEGLYVGSVHHLERGEPAVKSCVLSALGIGQPFGCFTTCEIIDWSVERLTSAIETIADYLCVLSIRD